MVASAATLRTPTVTPGEIALESGWSIDSNGLVTFGICGEAAAGDGCDADIATRGTRMSVARHGADCRQGEATLRRAVGGSTASRLRVDAGEIVVVVGRRAAVNRPCSPSSAACCVRKPAASPLPPASRRQSQSLHLPSSRIRPAAWAASRANVALAARASSARRRRAACPGRTRRCAAPGSPSSRRVSEAALGRMPSASASPVPWSCGPRCC